jgi:hypothetical protein
MPLAGFQPAIAASKRPQTHALDCAAKTCDILRYDDDDDDDDLGRDVK